MRLPYLHPLFYGLWENAFSIGPEPEDLSSAPNPQLLAVFPAERLLETMETLDDDLGVTLSWTLRALTIPLSAFEPPSKTTVLMLDAKTKTRTYRIREYDVNQEQSTEVYPEES